MTKLRVISGAELLETMNHADPKDPVVKIDWEAKTIDVFGGDSGYTRDDPYWIAFRDVTEHWWLFQLAEKNWATPMLIARLDHALRTVREALNG